MSVPEAPKRFKMVLRVDHTGVSGTGVVAYGVMWSDGSLTLRWNGEYASLVHWRELEHLLAVHGHDGATCIEWIDTGGEELLSAEGFEDAMALHQWENQRRSTRIE